MPGSKNSKRGTKAASGKPSERANRRRSRGNSFRPIKRGFKQFKSGRSEEYTWRRQYPLYPEDLEELHQFTSGIVKRLRKRGQWFFVSLLVKGLGEKYEVKIDAEEDPKKPPRKWVSTRVQRDLRKLKDALRDLDELIEFHLQGQAAWILRVRVTVFKPTGPPDRYGVVSKSREIYFE